MTATLIHSSPLSLIVSAMRKCTGRDFKTYYPYHTDLIRYEDKELIKRKILKLGCDVNDLESARNPAHESVLEHIVYTFDLSFSRAVLQEIARHRIASLSVESTRYCLNKKDEIDSYKTGNNHVDNIIYNTIIDVLDIKAKNDVKKYALPEGAMTKCQWTINARSLRNFLNLRTRKTALDEIRKLAYDIYMSVPVSHRILYRHDCLWGAEHYARIHNDNLPVEYQRPY